jgi:hypothetical protein
VVGVGLEAPLPTPTQPGRAIAMRIAGRQTITFVLVFERPRTKDRRGPAFLRTGAK